MGAVGGWIRLVFTRAMRIASRLAYRQPNSTRGGNVPGNRERDEGDETLGSREESKGTIPLGGGLMPAHELGSVARSLVAAGKGILAADESAPTIEKRLKAVDVPSTEEHRRAYRELLFTTPGVSEFISGVILFDETIRQKASDGTPFPEVLSRPGRLPGIKGDQGGKAPAGGARDKS